jgi:lipopolysaccharide export system protein LptA
MTARRIGPGPLGRARVALAALVLAAAGSVVAADAAETPSRAAARTGSELRIDADEGLEWRRRDQVVIARGQARAVRGDLQVQARELRALYRDGPDGKAEIYRVIGDGAVRIATPNQTAFGQHGTYDVAQDHLVLTGGERVRLVSGADEISAERSLEYWPRADRLVARGNAIAIQPNREVHGETITAYFAEGADGTKQLDTAEAVENVKVVTAEETIIGDRSNYDAKTGMATVEGSVKILRGRDQLDGCRGEIDFNSGVSKLFACERSQTSDGRVRGRIQLNGAKAD